jgi:hypothetical protein
MMPGRAFSGMGRSPRDVIGGQAGEVRNAFDQGLERDGRYPISAASVSNHLRYSSTISGGDQPEPAA